MIRVVLTHDEILDACRKYLSDHGMAIKDDQELTLEHANSTFVNGIEHKAYKAVLSVEGGFGSPDERKWKPGDVVRLKTGGWPMTVDEYIGEEKCDADGGSSERTRRPFVHCVWFEKRPTGVAYTTTPNAQFVWDGPKSGTFHEGALEKCEPTK